MNPLQTTTILPFHKPFIFFLVLIILSGCRKDPAAIPPKSSNGFVSIDNAVFDTTKSRSLNTHPYGFDMQKQAYTLNGFGAFAGKSRTVEFSDGGSFQQVPVVKATGFNDYGFTYLAKDTAGVLWEIYQQRFNTTEYSWPVPITVFASKTLQPATQWKSWSGYEQGKNSLYYSFSTKVISTNAATSMGITNCIQLEYSAPDYMDTVYIKPGKGPVEIRSWRAHLHENNQPAYGGYR